MSERTATGGVARVAKRTAILGGTFDPVHNGHLAIAREVAARLGYERILFVPANSPPHKDAPPGAPAPARVHMLRLATELDPAFSVDSYEVDQGGISFTILTIRHFMSEGIFLGRPGLIIGEDLVAGFDSWREADELERLTDIVVVRRPGSSAAGFPRRHEVLENAVLDISSSDIRARIRAGKPVSALVPEIVARYIEAQQLYR